MIRRGELRWFRFGYPDKRRPVLIMGRDELLPSLSLVPVIPLSTQIRGIASEVLLTPEDGVLSPCVLKPEWIRAVERVEIDKRIGSLPEGRWPEVRRALMYVLGMDGGAAM
ncbi:MAG TPA: type II toxin-antitoxin system PemK/MazF family toxin [Candidatus Nanopelagicales bacterium]|nr:type II toxin-antitoxin system PemK/MazF family toxin [Candidatus Nanopelagicales bacterium]